MELEMVDLKVLQKADPMVVMMAGLMELERADPKAMQKEA